MVSLKSINSKMILEIPSSMLGILFLGLFFLFGSHIFRVQNLSQARRDLIAPPPQIERLSFGFQESIADTMWIRTIQDLDYCNQPASEKTCRGQSWLFQMLDAITNLSPQFRYAYYMGGLALSVIITDVEGGSRLFEKGAAAFPNDWRLNYSAAYHFIYEAHDPAKAAKYLAQAGRHGAPPWVLALATRLQVDAGNPELAEALLQEAIASKQDPRLIERMREKLANIKKPAQ